MCGIVGIYCKSNPAHAESNSDPLLKVGGDMLDSLRSRGPVECNSIEMGAAVLDHTRLSIIDVNTSSQPVFNEDRQVAVILDGEIYNFQELREQLEKKGHHFTSKSDPAISLMFNFVFAMSYLLLLPIVQPGFARSAFRLFKLPEIGKALIPSFLSKKASQ